MSLWVPFFNIGFIALLLYFCRERGDLKRFYWTAALLKVLAGISVGIMYWYYYRLGDTIGFWKDAHVLAAFARNNFAAYVKFLWNENSQPEIFQSLIFQEYRSLLMVKIVSIFSLLAMNNYWIISIYLSVISFFGSWYLIKIIQKNFREILPGSVFSFLFLPSVVFWSSGLIKESVAMGALFFISGIFIKLWRTDKFKWWEITLAITACLLVWKLKYYYAAVFFLIAFTSLVYKLLLSQRVQHCALIMKIFLWLLILLIPVFIAVNAHPNFRTSRILNVVVENYRAFISFSARGDAIKYSNLEPTIGSVLTNAPTALVSGLYRPFFWEASNPLQVLMSLENVLLLILTVVVILKLKIRNVAQHRLLTFTVLAYIIVLTIFITLSTPNFGTLSRYRVSFIPYFVLLLTSVPPASAIFQKTFQRLSGNKS